jgi:beta-galactosidase
MIQNSGILFGGDYNPEQWDESTWQADLDKLKQAHINTATINVFSWALLEPREAEFHFEQLDKIIALLEKNKMGIVLATATAAVPAWLACKYPEVMRVDTYGIQQKQGKRHNACPNSPIFQEKIKQLVTMLASRYHKVEALTHWHVSNEYGGYCYCENCARAFRVWLQEKYPSLTALNKAWDSNFWGHTYTTWEEILPPTRRSDVFTNGKPVLGGAALDYRRFQSDSLLKNYQLERDVIRQYDKTRPITTNLMGSQKELDYFKWAKELDVISWDSYPSLATPASFSAMQHDLMRGLKNKPFMLMEQTPNQQNWQEYNALKQPGEMRMLSYQALAHGAKTVQFFQLKQSRNGAEKFHGAVLSHRDSTNTRVFKEVVQLGQELASLPASFVDSTSKAEVALLFDWDSYWGIENCIGPTTELDYVKAVHQYYKAFYDRGIAVDFVSREADFSTYKLVVAPATYITTTALTTKLEAFTKNGGVFMTTTMSGLADEQDNILLGGYPGQWRELLGIMIDEVDARPADKSVCLLQDQQTVGRATTLCDLVQPTTAQVLARYGDSVFYQGMASVTVNAFGAGFAYYVGTYLDASGMDYLLEQVLTKVTLHTDHHPAVEVTTRVAAQEAFTFVINTSNQVQTLANPYPEALDLLTGQVCPEQLSLPAFGVCLLHQKR